MRIAFDLWWARMRRSEEPGDVTPGPFREKEGAEELVKRGRG